MKIFDRDILHKRRDRVANTISKNDFCIGSLFKESAERISIRKNKFGTVLNLGSRVFDLVELSRGKLEIGTLINADLSREMLNQLEGFRVQADEEFLPFQDNSFDLVVSIMNLHHVNDLPGVLIQVNRLLKKSGIFFASIVGEDSLKEMRESLVSAEVKHGNKHYLRVAPMIETKSLSDLMKRACFSDVIVDKEQIKMHYSNVKNIFSDIRNMGESQCIKDSGFIRRDVLKSCYEHYERNFSADGKLVCSYDVISVLGTKSGG